MKVNEETRDDSRSKLLLSHCYGMANANAFLISKYSWSRMAHTIARSASMQAVPESSLRRFSIRVQRVRLASFHRSVGALALEL